MKIRYKILIGTGLIWIVFLLLTSLAMLEFVPFSYIAIFFAVGIGFYLFSYYLLRLIILKRVEHLSRDSSEQQLPLKNDDEDEVSKIATHFNKMLESLKISNEKLSRRSGNINKENETYASKDHLSQLARYDALTALPNIVFFNEMLNRALNHAKRHNKILAILLIDLDRFENINDTFGQVAGDQVLKEIANRFSSELRSSDILARLSGDEFIILLNDIKQPKFASPVAEKLLHACAKVIEVNGKELFLSASIGICVFPNDGTSLEDLQKNADLALYKAKHSGGGIYQYFTNEMTLEANKHIQLHNALYKAMNNNEFVLYYQPKLNLANSSIAGVEALIRWIHPEIGFISPGNFIPQAEESGLMMEIGEWVLREACRACKSWQKQGYQPITIAVNLSPKQFAHDDITDIVKKVLLETGLDPTFLELEITEMTIIDDVDAAAMKLRDIKNMGVKICIDDFGMGYTSISYLKKLPIDVLKVDQNFIKGIPVNQNDAAITSAIIALGHNLGMKVIAEGVESAEQLQYLAEHDCDLVQGYYFSRPLTERKIVLLLQKT